MDGVAPAHIAVWGIAGLSAAAIILRPWDVNQAVWAVLGSAALVLTGLLPLRDTLEAIGRGTDVYLFLTGMMLLAEVARQEGLFDWLAAKAVTAAKGSAARLFSLVYGVGICVTALLSNDATAVVLTPAVFAAAKAANAKPLPYLFVCAFIANAASFVLPISNPANLVVYNGHMPSLQEWFGLFALPSFAAIGVTFAMLRRLFCHDLGGAIESDISYPGLARGGRYAAYGIVGTAIALAAASAFEVDLGAPAFGSGVVTAAAIFIADRRVIVPVLKRVSWEIVPLVAGLFVLVAGIADTGAIGALSQALASGSADRAYATAWEAGVGIALISNLVNNLPAGLIAESAAAPAHLAPQVTAALLIGVDLGPNLSVTGSLATLLWLIALRREGVTVSAARFLKIGAIVMPAGLLCALAALVL